MILFCEDCGEKNLLDSTQLKSGKAVFKCDSCGYMNAYFIKVAKESLLEKTDAFFKVIQSFPEIIGSFLFHKKIGLIKNNMPGILKETDLNILGKLLTKNFSDCCSQYPDVNEMALVISNKNMIVKMINNNLAVIIACKIFPVSKNIMDQLNRLISNDKTENK